MIIKVLDPLAEINRPGEGKPFRRLGSLQGRQIGMLWGRHAASMKFWPAFEEAVLAKYAGEAVRLYKKSTWNPATQPEIEELAERIDYALIGVGA